MTSTNVLSSRDREQRLIDLCVAAVLKRDIQPTDPTEASVLVIAGLVIRGQHPEWARRLIEMGNSYFDTHGRKTIGAADAQKRGLIPGLPRFKSMLVKQIELEMKNASTQTFLDDTLGEGPSRSVPTA